MPRRSSWAGLSEKNTIVKKITDKWAKNWNKRSETTLVTLGDGWTACITARVMGKGAL